MNDHIFFDIKADDPNPKNATITEMAAIRTDGDGNVVSAFNEEFTKDTYFDVALQGLRSVVLEKRSEKVVIVSHFGEYSRTLLLSACKSAGLFDPFDGRVWIDTAQLCWPLVFSEVIPNRDLRSMAKYYGVGTNGIDTAKGDADITRECYWFMMDRFRIAQRVEGGIRRVGNSFMGRVFSGINK